MTAAHPGGTVVAAAVRQLAASYRDQADRVRGQASTHRNQHEPVLAHFAMNRAQIYDQIADELETLLEAGS